MSNNMNCMYYKHQTGYIEWCGVFGCFCENNVLGLNFGQIVGILEGGDLFGG